MNNIFVGVAVAIGVWFVYFQTVDWFLMGIQGLKYFEYIRSVF
jgi:hypothetical protein